MENKAARNILLVSVPFFVVGVCYIFYRQFFYWAWMPGVKAFPVVWLIALLPMMKDKPSKLVVPGLLFSAVGDITIGTSFQIGMAAFLAAHIFYAVSFSAKRGWKAWKLAIIIPVLVWVSYMVWALHTSPDLGNPVLKASVHVYMAAISIMVVFAVLRQRSYLALVPIGALLFMASDSMLAWHKFVAPIPMRSILVMSTYYLAQYFIAVGSAIDSSREATEAREAGKHGKI